MVLIRCDQCDTQAAQGECGWIVVGHVIVDDGFEDDAGFTLHFCSWSCAGTYTTARALVDS